MSFKMRLLDVSMVHGSCHETNLGPVRPPAGTSVTGHIISGFPCRHHALATR
nr:hypothetical protein [Candidatus Sigynarchaeota archaeon]